MPIVLKKAKANASQVIPEFIKIATNITYRENSDDKHSKNAKFGWYRCTVRFTLPTYDDKGNVIGKNVFQGRMILYGLTRMGKNICMTS